MKVKELIEQLQQCPQDSDVVLEFYDGYNNLLEDDKFYIETSMDSKVVSLTCDYCEYCCQRE